MKKIIGILLAAALLVTLMPTAFASGVYGTKGSVSDYGWSTDGSFDGWSTADGVTVTGSFASAVENTRIWKSLITDPGNFTVTVDYAASSTASGYVKVLGNMIELDGRGGNGNQLYLKVNSQSKDWIVCTDCKAKVSFTRKSSGSLTVVISGESGGSQTLSLTASAESSNVELGMYQGTVTFGNITAGAPTDPVVTDKTPGDFGWSTDDGANFSGWKTTDGISLTGVFASTVGNHRIWKNLLADQSDFTVKLTWSAGTETSGYIKLLGNTIELDTRGGDGNQLYLKTNSQNVDWITASGCEAAVTITRTSGGEITLSVAGVNGTTKTVTLSALESSENIELGLYAGTVLFGNIEVTQSVDPQQPTTTPGDFGWETDEVSGTKDFTGWAAEDESNFSGIYAETTGEHRIWKQVTENWNGFYIGLIYSGASNASAYFKLLGQIIELDGRGGNGNQVYVKVNSQGKDWLDAKNCVVKVTFTRGTTGNVTVKLTGSGNATPLSFTVVPTDANPNFEIGLYAGRCKFNSFTAAKEAPAEFSDVPLGAWYYNVVYQAVARGLFKGISATTFEPQTKMTRAMMVMILYHLEGAPDVTGLTATFKDVYSGKWYTNAVLWANSKGIVTGYNSATFGTNDPVTREQAVLILQQYSRYKGLDVTKTSDITTYPDYSKVASYARGALSWAVAEGLLSGTASGGKVYLNPKGNASRAEMAAIFVRFTDWSKS